MNCFVLFGFLALLCLQFNTLVGATEVQNLESNNPEIAIAGNDFGHNPNNRMKRQYGYGMYGMGGYPYGGYGGYGMGYPMGGNRAASMLGMGLMMLGR